MSSEVPVAGGWRGWLAPPASITDVTERRSVALVASLVTVIISCAVTAIAVGFVIARDWVVANLPVLIVMLAHFVGLLALNRSRHHRLAALLLCLGPLWSNLAVGIRTPADPVWYAMVPLGALLASALLRVRTALVIAVGGVACTAAVVVIRHDVYGTTRGLLITGATIFVSAVVLGVARFRDRVERGRLAEVERLAHQLAASERLESIGRLAGGIAHDFNNLLTVILANTGLARRGRGVPESLDGIEDAATRAAELTGQLLAFTRHTPAAPATVVIDDVARSLQPLLRRLVPENIELEFALGATWAVKFDESQLQRVLLNLAANARDAMPGGGRLRVATSQVSGPGAADERVRLEVTDSGTGMDEATRAHAFEPFYTTKPLGHGTGLGLATVHGIVRQNGGTIELVSAPGAGTTVAITLPRTHALAAEATAAAATTTPAQLHGVAMLVEDDPHVRRTTERILRDLGLRVIVAACPAEVPPALAAATTAGCPPIDLLVSDVVMPGQNGLDLAAELRAAHPGLAVVLMSGYSERDVIAATARPDTRFVAKPFTAATLGAAVELLLARRPAPAIAAALAAE